MFVTANYCQCPCRSKSVSTVSTENHGGETGLHGAEKMKGWFVRCVLPVTSHLRYLWVEI